MSTVRCEERSWSTEDAIREDREYRLIFLPFAFFAASRELDDRGTNEVAREGAKPRSAISPGEKEFEKTRSLNNDALTGLSSRTNRCK